MPSDSVKAKLGGGYVLGLFVVLLLHARFVFSIWTFILVMLGFVVIGLWLGAIIEAIERGK